MSKKSKGKPADGLTPDQWLSTAQSDFEAAVELTRKGLWPQAVFHLQQSVEKTAKSMASAHSLAAAETLRTEVGHDLLAIPEAVAAREELLARMKHIAERRLSPGSVAEQLEVGRAASARAKEHVAKFRRHNSGPLSLSAKDLEAIIAAMRRYKANVDQLTPSEWREGLAHFVADNVQALDGLVRALKIEGWDAATQARVGRQFAKAGYRLMKQAFAPMVVLCECHVFQHQAVATRYGYQGKAPAEIYRPDHPLVKRLPALLEIRGETLLGMRRYYSALRRYNVAGGW